MDHHSVMLELPDALYERLQQVAEADQRPLEMVMVDGLNLLFGAKSSSLLDASPETLINFTDSGLWAIVTRHLAQAEETHLRELVARQKSGEVITEAEQREMETLLKIVDHYVLLRSQALVLLKQRGHDVNRWLEL